MQRFLFATLMVLVLHPLSGQKPKEVFSGGKCLNGDCLNGYGVFTFDNGDRYEGEFKDGDMHGIGTYTSKEKQVYQGQYSHSVRHGYGTYKWPDGDQYIGEYVNNKREGQGTYIDAKGHVYEGLFKNGEYLGPVQQKTHRIVVDAVKPTNDKTPLSIEWITPTDDQETSFNQFIIKACVSTGSPIKSVTTYLNGEEVAASRGFSVEEEKECSNFIKRTIPLVAGENTISLKVVNTNGEVLEKQSSVIIYNQPEMAATPLVNASEKRTALVIGNSSYDKTPLKNPANDAVSMASTLKNLGFEVMLFTDMSQNDMKKAIREFGAKLKANGGIGMFYYSGHGMQANGNNFLLPIGANIAKEADVEYEAVDIGRIVVEMEYAKNPMNIIVLDACRDNPYSSYRGGGGSGGGLTAVERVPTGTFIAYSTAPGSVASDGDGKFGLYTQELLKVINQPGLKIEDVFKQVRVNVRKLSAGKQIPWENSSIESDFYFFPQAKDK